MILKEAGATDVICLFECSTCKSVPFVKEAWHCATFSFHIL